MRTIKSVNKYTTYIKQNWKTPHGIAGFLLVVVILSGLLFTALANSNFLGGRTSDDEQKEEQVEKVTFNTPYTIIYGTWTNESTLINAYDLETGDSYNLASLPVNVKKATLAGNEIIYLADTTDTDHGLRIAARNLTTGTERTIYEPVDGYGIDDYQISPNHQYIATWEVTLAPEGHLFGGKSKVVSFELTGGTSSPNTIVEEDADHPVLYPLAVTNDGRVFMDKFLPNSGAGWAYGMEVSDFNGNNRQAIPGMTNGTYGTQPKLSPDGQTLVFAAYTGADGAQEVDGFRNALVNPNAIRTLDASNLTITTLPNLPSTDKYVDADWNSDSQLIYTRISKTPGETGEYLYDISTSASEKLPDEESEIAFKELPNNVVLYGTVATSFSNIIGNLGSTYSVPFTKISVENRDGKKAIPLASNVIQVIDIQPNSSEISSIFSTAHNSTSRILDDTQTQSRESLRLDYFVVKQDLEPTRVAQQSDPVPQREPQPQEPEEQPDDEPIGVAPKEDNNTSPPPNSDENLPTCKEVYEAQCGTPIGEQTICDDQGCRGNPEWIAWNECKSSVIKKGEGSTCSDSPLYLYGPEGLKVDVQIHTQIFNENISLNNNSYTFTLDGNNKFYSGDRLYQSLKFDYTPAAQLRTPTRGVIVSSHNIQKAVKEFAKRLGLNQTETTDLINDISSKTHSPYIFLSYYSQTASKYMLPISFSPQPDTYINYIFYVKNLDSLEQIPYSPKEPTFEKVKRGNFTAVEISVIVDN